VAEEPAAPKPDPPAAEKRLSRRAKRPSITVTRGVTKRGRWVTVSTIEPDVIAAVEQAVRALGRPVRWQTYPTDE
jgi:hypothetical protein